MRFTFLFTVILLTIVSSCQEHNSKYSTQLKTADSLIQALYNYDTGKIRSWIGVDPKELGEDDYHYLYKVRTTSELLKKYGIPKRQSYTIKEYSKEDINLVDVIVPIYKSDKSQLEEATLFINFVRFLPPYKIALFRLETRNRPGTTLAPDSL